MAPWALSLEAWLVLKPWSCGRPAPRTNPSFLIPPRSSPARPCPSSSAYQGGKVYSLLLLSSELSPVTHLICRQLFVDKLGGPRHGFENSPVSCEAETVE